MTAHDWAGTQGVIRGQDFAQGWHSWAGRLRVSTLLATFDGSDSLGADAEIDDGHARSQPGSHVEIRL